MLIMSFLWEPESRRQAQQESPLFLQMTRSVISISDDTFLQVDSVYALLSSVHNLGIKIAGGDDDA